MAFVSLMVVALTFASCGGRGATGTFDLEDGTYEGASDASHRGYVWVELEISDGEIVEVEMKEFRGDGSEKTPETYDYEEWAVAVEELPAAVIEAQSSEVDAIAGATSTSELFMQAVRRALGEEDDETGPFPDGEHVGYSDPGPRGYVSAHVVVQRGTITDVQLREFQGDGSEKTPETYSFEEWAEAAEELPWRVIEEQSTDIDGYAGATSTSDKFVQALRRALGEDDALAMGPYEDGSHAGRSDTSARNGWVEVEVNVLLGHIVSVSMEEYADGVAKSPETYDYEEWAVALEELPERVLEAQSADIDAVAGATSTSDMFVQAVRRALGEEEPADVTFVDGEHVGYSDPGPRGYVSARVVVENGEIVEAELREFQGDGSEKSADTYTYEEWAVAAEELPERVLEAQSSDIDGIAGATSTYDKFVQALRRALNEEPALVQGPYEDGTYSGRSDESDRGGWVEVEVSILLGQIVSISMEEYADGEPKSPETYDYEEWAVALEELPERALEAQSADVDAVTGATSTSDMFVQALERALEDAS